MHNLICIIPCATPGMRLKSFGPRSLLKVNGETLIHRQLRIISRVFPEIKPVVVCGHFEHRMHRTFPAHSGVTIVSNPDFETTNVAISIALAMEAVPSRRSLVIYGDLFFKKSAIQPLVDCRESAIIYDTSPADKSKIGVNVVDGEASHFSYGMPAKWPGIVFLEGREKELFHSFASEPHRSQFYGHEILNLILAEDETRFKAFESPSSIFDVDNPKDLRHLQTLYSKETVV